MEFESIVNAAAKLMQEAGDFTRDDERLLDNLRNIGRYFQEVRELESVEGTIESACKIVLFTGYLSLKCCTTAFSKALHEIKAEETNLPERLRPKVTEMTSYLGTLMERNREIDSTIHEAKLKMEEFSNRSPIFNMSRDEKIKMEMLMRNLKRNLAIAKSVLSEAENTQQSLQSDVTKYLIKEGVLAAGSTTLMTTAAWGIFTGFKRVYEFFTNAIAVGNVVRNGTLAVGAAGIVYHVYSINVKFENYQTTCNELKSRLNSLKVKYREKGQLADGVGNDFNLAKREAENNMWSH